VGKQPQVDTGCLSVFPMMNTAGRSPKSPRQMTMKFDSNQSSSLPLVEDDLQGTDADNHNSTTQRSHRLMNG